MVIKEIIHIFAAGSVGGTIRPRPGGYPEHIMKFKVDSYLKTVVAAMAAPKDPETVAVEMCARFIDAGMLDNEPCYFGCKTVEAMGPQYLSDLCGELSEYLYGVRRSINCDVFNAFCKITVIGDGDCPHCGGELKYIETEGHELNDGDYFTPNSYVDDNDVYRCVQCGETIKKPIL